MKDIQSIRYDNRLARVVLDALPCGLMVIDRRGRIVALNNIIESVFGIREIDVIQRRYGEIIGCLDARTGPGGCGASSHCRSCEIQEAARSALSSNRVYKSRVYLQLVVDGRVQGTQLVIHAAPFEFDRKRFCLLLLEDLNQVQTMPVRRTGEDFWGIVGRSPKMLALFEDIRDAAQTDAPVLMESESGTGKELAALAVHKESRRADKLFVPINCGALPEGLLESELFGHVKGAYTNATHDKKGRFGLADGGTIFLDEISELTPAMQVKFLRVLESGTFEPVGSDRTKTVDVRIISATNANLADCVASGRFRADLYYRICVVPIQIPPLRRRAEDVPLLSEHFLDLFAQDNFQRRPAISRRALAILMDHHWPGNVRELRNVIHYAAIKCKGRVIEPAHLPATISQKKAPKKAKRPRRPKIPTNDVLEALKRTGGNRSHAAKLLKVSRSTLYRALDRQREQNGI